MVTLHNPYASVPENMLLINSVTQIVLALLILIVSFLVFQKYLKVRSKALRYLLLTISNIGIAFLLGGIGAFTSWTQYSHPINPDPIVYGLPIPFVTGGYWPLYSMSLVFGMLSFIFMLYFSANVFQKPGKLVLSIFTVIGVVWIIYAIYYCIFIYGLQLGFDPDSASVGTIGLVAFLILGLVVYIPLAFVALKTSRTQNEKVFRTGLQLIGYSAVAIVLYLALFAINGELSLNLDIIPIFFAFIAMVLIYLGYVMPDWLVRRLGGKSSQ